MYFYLCVLSVLIWFQTIVRRQKSPLTMKELTFTMSVSGKFTGFYYIFNTPVDENDDTKHVCWRVDVDCLLDWPQSLKQCFINVSYNVLVASLTLMALF